MNLLWKKTADELPKASHLVLSEAKEVLYHDGCSTWYRDVSSGFPTEAPEYWIYVRDVPGPGSPWHPISEEPSEEEKDGLFLLSHVFAGVEIGEWVDDALRVDGEPDFEASHWFPLPGQPPRALSETPSAEPLSEARKPDVEEGTGSPSVNTCLQEGASP